MRIVGGSALSRGLTESFRNIITEGHVTDVDLPLNIHPVAFRASAVDTPFGAV